MHKALVALVLLVPSLAISQALPNINSLSVRYNARRVGTTGEMRRQFAKGMALLNKAAQRKNAAATTTKQ